jgi:hypothetical protein
MYRFLASDLGYDIFIIQGRRAGQVLGPYSCTVHHGNEASSFGLQLFRNGSRTRAER